MTFLDELGREIERVAYAPPRRRRRFRSLALFAVLPLGVATAAVAATGIIGAGEPVKNPPGLHLNPKTWYGVIRGSGTLFDLRVPDPAGGPPWAMRMVKTSRGLGCVQVGRLVDGKLGVLGRDASFDNDGLFHERGPQVLAQTDCQQRDGAGNVFIAMAWQGMPDSADAAACVPRKCPQESLRTLYYGLLGPDAVAVTYRDRAGALHRQPVSRPAGAYLVVMPANPKRKVSNYAPGTSPGNGLSTIEYADGSRCKVGEARHCPLKGYVMPKLPSLTAAQLATPLRLHVGTKPVYPGHLPPGQRHRQQAQRLITVVFRARVAADAHSYYTFYATTPRSGKKNCHADSGGLIARDLAAGTVVTRTLYVPYNCRGSMTVSIGYVQQRTPSQMPFELGFKPDFTVGAGTVTVPG